MVTITKKFAGESWSNPGGRHSALGERTAAVWAVNVDGVEIANIVKMGCVWEIVIPSNYRRIAGTNGYLSAREAKVGAVAFFSAAVS